MRLTIEEKADKLVKENKVKLVSSGRSLIFEVAGTEYPHTVVFNEKGFSCDCAYWTLRSKICSHVLACIIFSKLNKININIFGSLLKNENR